MEDSTGIVTVNLNLHICIYLSIQSDIIVPEKPIGFVWVAGVLAPHTLQVDCTDWAIVGEHSIKLIVVVLHDLSIVLIAAKRLGGVNEWASLCNGIGSDGVLDLGWGISSVNEDWLIDKRWIITRGV